MEQPPRTEHDYPNNQSNPGPSEEAVTEKNDKPAGKTLNWVTIIAVTILAIFLLFYFL